MKQRAIVLKGKLIGRPFMASIDCQNHRMNKSDAVLVVRKGSKVEKGYCGYILEENELPVDMNWIQDEGISYILGVEQCITLVDYDVVEVNSQGIINVRYRADSADNVIFITNSCNSNCIMCPDSEMVRRKGKLPEYEYLYQYINLIPDDTCHLTITGGEPTLLKEKLLELIFYCKQRFESTSFLLLTNGRTFSNLEYAKRLIEVRPEKFRVAIPIYSCNEQKHEAITRVKGSFLQAIRGISNIMHNIEVEVRIVVMKNNYQELPKIAKMLVEKLESIKSVSFMGLELMGNAAINRQQIWIDYKESASYVQEAAYTLLQAGIEPRIYNYPLCTLPEYLWSIAVRSITDYKVRYKEECEGCCVKQRCGGFFFSTIHFDETKITPIERKNG